MKWTRGFVTRVSAAAASLSLLLLVVPAASDSEVAQPPAPRLSLLQSRGMGSIPLTPDRLPPGPRGWREAGLSPVRGMTIGPIESEMQPGRGYGSAPFDQTLGEIERLGSNWISLTVFGRVWDLKGGNVDLSFEKPHDFVRESVRASVRLAHARGLRVLLVPHLWLESGQWRAEIEPGSAARRAAWEESYGQFVLSWADLAQEADIDMLAAGVELRSWVTTARAPSFVRLIEQVRGRYGGLLTYAANWDDAADTVVWGHLDVIGINAFYPLHWEEGATWQQVEAGGYRVAEQVEALAKEHERPVLFTEFGYTTRKDTAIKPWLWPEELGRVDVDQKAQARAYAGLLGAMREVPGFAGAIVWRMYADIADMSQEAEWGFSPWGKQSAPVLQRLFADPRWGDPLPKTSKSYPF